MAVDFAAVATNILDEVADILAGTPYGPLEHTFVFHGRRYPADTCDTLGASWLSIEASSTGPGGGGASTQRQRCGYPWRVGSLSIAWLRSCYPGITNSRTNPFPSRDDEDDAARKLLADVDALSEMLPCRFPPKGDPVVQWEGVRPIDPDGGCAGWELQLTVWVRNQSGDD